MVTEKEKSKGKEKTKKRPKKKMKEIMWKLQQGYYGPQVGIFCSQFSSF